MIMIKIIIVNNTIYNLKYDTYSFLSQGPRRLECNQCTARYAQAGKNAAHRKKVHEDYDATIMVQSEAANI